MADRELPCTTPRPLAYLLPKAVAAFIAHKCDRFKMIVPAWGRTFHVEPGAVRAEWERQMTVKSQQIQNYCEETDK